jgi:hypothetical protein
VVFLKINYFFPNSCRCCTREENRESRWRARKEGKYHRGEQKCEKEEKEG